MDDHVEGAAAVDAGAAVVAGSFSGTVVFGEGGENETELTASGDSDLFLAKYEPDGALSWVIAPGGAGEDWARAVAASEDGSSVLVGVFVDSIQIGDTAFKQTELTSASGTGAFAAKFDSDGGLVWVTEMEFPDSGLLSMYTTMNAAIAPDGSTYLSGAFAGTCVIGAGDPSEVSLSSELGDHPPPGYLDRLLVKIAP